MLVGTCFPKRHEEGIIRLLYAYMKGIIEDTWADKKENERKERDYGLRPRINDEMYFTLPLTHFNMDLKWFMC